MKVRYAVQRESSVEICKRNGWVAGTRLVGDVGYGPTVIEITAVGRESILAVEISHNGKLTPDEREGHWTLTAGEWEEVSTSQKK